MRLLPLIAAFVATPALAQQASTPVQVTPVPARPGQPPATVIVEPVGMMIAAFDSDGDGRVTRAEFDAGLKRSFDAVDGGKAGAIGYIDFSDWSERWLGDRNTLPSPFETDRDGDNKVSYAELAQRFTLYFERFDVDKDGVIVRRELVEIRPPAMAPRRRGRRGN